jgi:hypothetical protein
MRISSSPTLCIAAGLLLAALLSIVGYQVFRRWISHGPEALLERADAASCRDIHPDSPQGKTKTNIEIARLFKRFALERSTHVTFAGFQIPSPFCAFSFGRDCEFSFGSLMNSFSCAYPITALA